MYQTVKRGDPKLDVTFDLTTMLEHVTLVITDKSAGEYFHTVLPIARVALGILHLKALGGALTAKEDAIVKFCAAVPMFKQQMDAYVAGGAMGKF